MASVYAQLRDAIAERFAAAEIDVPILIGRPETFARDARTRVVLIPGGGRYQPKQTAFTEDGVTRRQAFTRVATVTAVVFLAKQGTPDLALENLENLCDNIAVAAKGAAQARPVSLRVPTEEEQQSAISNNGHMAAVELEIDVSVWNELLPLVEVETVTTGVYLDDELVETLTTTED